METRPLGERKLQRYHISIMCHLAGFRVWGGGMKSLSGLSRGHHGDIDQVALRASIRCHSSVVTGSHRAQPLIAGSVLLALPRRSHRPGGGRRGGHARALAGER